VTSISGNVFSGCSGLTSISVESGNTKYDSRDNCNAIIETKTSTLIRGCKNTTIPNSVTGIEYSAFSSCSGLTSITIPNSVTFIGDGAFRNCSGLTSVMIPNSVKSIENSAFADCSNLTSVTIPNSVTKIRDYAFRDCSGLTSVTVERATPITIGSDVFTNRTNATLYVPQGSKSAYQAANYWKEFKEIVEYSTTTSYSLAITSSTGGSVAYAGNTISGATNSYSVDEGTSHTLTITPNSGYRLKSVVVNGVDVTSSVMNNQYTINDISQNTTVSVTFEDNSLNDGDTFTAKTVEGIDMTIMVISAAEKTCQVGDNSYSTPAINQNTSGAITIPSNINGFTVASIGDYSFNGCSGLTSIIIPISVTSIGDGAFMNCSGLSLMTIPNSVVSIGSAAFLDCSNLTSITIPNGVTRIEDGTFYECSGLTSITIPNSVTSIGDQAFWHCGSLTSITIPNGVTSIGSEAFSGCSGLTSITIPNSVTSLGYQAFVYCSVLTSITIPNSVTSIGEGAFAFCGYLTSITIPNSVTNIGVGAFAYCSDLTSIAVESNNTKYDSRENCNAIIETSTNKLVCGCESTMIPNSVTSIGNSAFNGCRGLTSITIPNSVTSIGDGAFCDCSGLTSVTVERATPISIESNTFSNRTNATLIVPQGSKSAYQETNYWKEFKEIVEYATTSTYSLSITTSTGGSVSYAGNSISGTTMSYTVDEGTSHTLTITPNSSYRVKNVVLNGTDVTSSVENDLYMISDISQDMTVVVMFEEIPPTTYTLAISSSGGGTVSYSGHTINNGTTQYYTVNEGTDYTLNFTPHSGYRLESIVVNGEDVTASVVNNQYTISNISQNTTVNVTFEEIPPTPLSNYVLTIYLPKHGYVETGLEEVNVDERARYYSMDEGSSQNLTFVPHSGYRLESVRVNGEDVMASVVNNQYTINNVYQDMDVQATFVADHEQTWTVAGDVPSFGTAWDPSNTANDMSSADGVNYTLVLKNVVLEASGKYTYKVVADHEWGEEYPVDDPAEITVQADGLYTITFTFNKDSKRVSAEVTKIDLVEMTANGVNYTVTSYTDRTVNVAAGRYGKVLMVPATLEYEGLTWTVKGIDRDVLVDKTDLAAVVWNPDVAFTAEVPNPNLLLYVKSASYAPSTVNNLVVNGVAQRITLTEADSGNDFYCPQAFSARSITYSHSYQMTTGIDKCQGWETIALPFDVQNVSHATKGTIVPFAARTNNGQKAFWLYELTSSGWRAATAIKAYTPYIISMPNNELYYDEARLNGRITFSAADVTVPVTSETPVTYRGRTFVPNFLRQQQRDGVYTLNVNNDWYSSTNGTEGSLFIVNQRSVSPFEAYMTTTSGSRTSFGVFEDTTTEIRGVEELIDANRMNVYNLNGQQRKVGNDASMDELKRTLPAGVYIINGQKVIVR